LQFVAQFQGGLVAIAQFKAPYRLGLLAGDGEQVEVERMIPPTKAASGQWCQRRA